jgi:nucleotide-binding universal stress UspA family protein
MRKFLVLHLLAPGDGDLELAMSRRMVDQIVSGLRRCGVRARGAGRTTSREIARTALEYGADLIVMDSRRLPSLSRLVRAGPSPT